MKKILVLIAIFGVFSSFSLKAETTSSWYNKFYVGAGVGFVGDIELNIVERDIPHNEIDVKNSLDVFFGYDLSKLFAIEIGYQNFLKSNYTEDTMKRSTKGTNLHTSLIFKTNIKKHSTFLGVGIGKTDLKSIIIQNGLNQDRSAINYMISAGYGFNITSNNQIGAKFTFNYLPSIDYSDITGTLKKFEKGYFNQISLYYKYSFNN